METCEIRQLLSAVSAPIDGVGNNQHAPHWGSSEIELLRIADAAYGDGYSSPAGQDRPNARLISNHVVAQHSSISNSRDLTDFVWMWGQFLDHDIDLTDPAFPAEAFDIEVPLGDSQFDPHYSGAAVIELNRSHSFIGADSTDGMRQQVNQITAFIDGSGIYGSHYLRANELRTFEGGRLKTSDGDMLPYNHNGYPNAGGTGSELFLAGDVRCNENIALSSMHVLWVREHNRIVDALATEHPAMDDQELYEQGRAIVAAEIQAITYNEFLPALLGSSAIATYAGYNDQVDPGITNEFSTAAFRLGHSLLSSQLRRTGPDGYSIAEGSIPLRDAFFNPAALIETGIDPLLRGASAQLAQELDVYIIDDVRNFLFGSPGQGGLDLPSLNIQRGRDHGLADYNTTRAALGLTPVASFSQISSDPVVAATLEATYLDVGKVDLWVGAIAEDHLPGSSLGSTFTAILVDQFQRLRDGDRFWYENVFSGDQLAEVRNTRLSDVIERNTNIDGLQTNVFFAQGKEIVDVRFAESGTRKATVRFNNGSVEVFDDVQRQVIVSRPSEDLAGLRLYGTDNLNRRVVVDGSVTGAMLPAGISYSASNSTNDTLVMHGTPSSDSISVAWRHGELNDLDVFFENVEHLVLEGDGGNDVLSANGSSSATVTLDGGSGNDYLTGGSGADRLLGGTGHDTLCGGGGHDDLYGGTGNDRLYGEAGNDGLYGGAGFDLLVQSGGIHSPGSRERLAAFLDRRYNLMTTGSDFYDWGGRGERWFFGNAGWMFITPNGYVYQWDGQPGANGELIAKVHSECHADLSLLVDHASPFADEDSPTSTSNLARSLDQSLPLRFTGNLFQNWGGRNEKWLRGDAGWYFLTPDGRLYEWDGLPGADGRLVGELDSLFHEHIELLHSAG